MMNDEFDERGLIDSSFIIPHSAFTLMSYLIDGNNVMGQRVGWHRDKAGARRRLLGELARFARVSGVTVEAVFDGAPDEFFPGGSEFLGGGVFFAARGSNA